MTEAKEKGRIFPILSAILTGIPVTEHERKFPLKVNNMLYYGVQFENRLRKFRNGIALVVSLSTGAAFTFLAIDKREEPDAINVNEVSRCEGKIEGIRRSIVTLEAELTEAEASCSNLNLSNTKQD